MAYFGRICRVGYFSTLRRYLSLMCNKPIAFAMACRFEKMVLSPNTRLEKTDPCYYSFSFQPICQRYQQAPMQIRVLIRTTHSAV